MKPDAYDTYNGIPNGLFFGAMCIFPYSYYQSWCTSTSELPLIFIYFMFKKPRARGGSYDSSPTYNNHTEQRAS
jgi:hypothetical protein